MENYINFAEGEITVCCGENARTNTEMSLKQSLGIIESGKGNVLYINTVFTKRKLNAIARETLGDVEFEGLHYQQVIMGDLQKYFAEFKEVVEKENIKTIVINSWEFANNGYTYKEKALCQLRYYADALGLSVLVYSQAAYTFQTGVMARGGLGKLAVIADEIINLSSLHLQMIPTETIMSTPKKINTLEYAQNDLSIFRENLVPNFTTPVKQREPEYDFVM
jgi:hypothetical protein